ncbi:MAG: lysine--tRNA ligase [Candidatus Yanofskybacteria bacterium RIFCSPLOWO2_02_FULL_47_9b]|uniref:Lysine--tRNA ligase n=1 Tax=Candidatus Yanofskybacteria bacterium RIFCSPLOWO2_02_FULL_47_9b TaxID=1802708 RepID=A0A1F8H9H9_9BACT|nr:MAG: lysine--tRNA ligase [Candidatus Yanofskybacteria bacterium RIFCSPLOWO2_02_FULL_47_9b]
MALDEIRKVKIEKLEKLRKAGIDPYPASTRRSMSVAEAVQNFDKLSEAKDEVILAGRMMARREHGGSIFFDMDDGSGRIQGFIKEDVVGAEMFERFRDLFDTGDIIEVAGHLFKTKKEERTVEVKHCVILSKALLPLPEKWHGLTDVEERFRKRYLDLALNEDIRQTFKTRAVVIKALRDFLNEHDFLEVSTPTLQPLYGGASARPFKTHMHALDVDLFLRVAPELYLKRLLVGGFEKVFEFTTNFRNEGMDRDHNPEFYALEFYAAYKGLDWLMDFTEELLRTAVKAVYPDGNFKHESRGIDFNQPFKRVKFKDLLKDYKDSKEADELFKKNIRPTLVEPTFVIDWPTELLPLAKKTSYDPKFVSAFQFFAGGLEMIKAFTELNDPIDQRERFAAQESNRAKGDEEAQRMDDDFVEALEYGMPPAAGWGLGLDRFVMLLTDSHSIREVLLFPTMKPKKDE